MTKPAGCFLQLVSLPLGFGGLMLLVGGLSPGGSYGRAFLGLVLIGLALAAFVAAGRSARARL